MKLEYEESLVLSWTAFKRNATGLVSQGRTYETTCHENDLVLHILRVKFDGPAHSRLQKSHGCQGFYCSKVSQSTDYHCFGARRTAHRDMLTAFTKTALRMVRDPDVEVHSGRKSKER